MASYVRLGPYLLSSEIAADPAGRIHRGLSLTGSTLDNQVYKVVGLAYADHGVKP